MTEEWRICPLDENFLVSNLGRVRTVDRQTTIAPARRAIYAAMIEVARPTGPAQAKDSEE
jgi:hypothetical protein